MIMWKSQKCAEEKKNFKSWSTCNSEGTKKFKQIMLWLKTFDHNLCYPNKRFSPVNTFLLFEIITADISK